MAKSPERLRETPDPNRRMTTTEKIKAGLGPKTAAEAKASMANKGWAEAAVLFQTPDMPSQFYQNPADFINPNLSNPTKRR